mgnify:CR=1 FL=1
MFFIFHRLIKIEIIFKNGELKFLINKTEPKAVRISEIMIGKKSEMLDTRL